jgi:hypothetical protein
MDLWHVRTSDALDCIQGFVPEQGMNNIQNGFASAKKFAIYFAEA